MRTPSKHIPARLFRALAAAGLSVVLLASSNIATAETSTTRTVSYQGLNLPVPAGWQVHDLSRDPRTCVRFDQNAIYLGTPGDEQRCPARAFGRTEAILVQRAPATAAGGFSTAAIGEKRSITSRAGADDRASTVLSGTGLMVTASYGERPELVDQAIGQATYRGPQRFTPKAKPDTFPSSELPSQPAQPTQPTEPTEPTQPGLSAKTQGGKAVGGTATQYTGYGFDTCTAPSKSTMRAWLKSPYRVVGVYIGGVNRACADGNLNAGWVRTAAEDGWRMLPIYVGRQAPCVHQKDLGRIRSKDAAGQGRAAADDAVKRAKHFGMSPGSTLYNDIEGYDDTNAGCRKVVLSFLGAWTKRLHELGYLSGVYSSASSGIKHLSGAYASKSFVRPDAIWTARWDKKSSLSERNVDGSHWSIHQRAKQHRGPHIEKWGGRKIEIDSNVIDAPLASARYRFKVDAKQPLRTRSGPSTSYPSMGTRPAGGTLDVICRTIGQRVGTTNVWSRLSDGSFVSEEYVANPRKVSAPGCSHAFQVETQVLRVRALPGLAAAIQSTIPLGGLAYIQCQGPGDPVKGNNIWDRLGRKLWVSDHYTASPGRPTFTKVIPRCS
ncbi:glycoside hydrolase domain-containing protein [Flindersiella endophytica]